MRFVHERHGMSVAVPGATVRLAAASYGVTALTRRGGGFALLHAGPSHVAVERDDGRRDVARVHDLDRAARMAIVVAGSLAVRAARRRRRQR
jgi:hypothetical protein